MICHCNLGFISGKKKCKGGVCVWGGGGRRGGGKVKEEEKEE